VDAQQKAESLYSRSVRQSELSTALGGKPTVMVIDACFSGRASAGQPIAAGLQPMILVHPAAAATSTLLTAGKSDQFAGPLPGSDRPAFSYLVLGALRGWGDANGDGVVTAEEALNYAAKALIVLPIGRAQTPELVSGSGSLALARNATEKAPNLTALVASMREGATPVAAAPPPASAGRHAAPVGQAPALLPQEAITAPPVCPEGNEWNGKDCAPSAGWRGSAQTTTRLQHTESTVIDSRTGLIWQARHSRKQLSWSEAVDYCTALRASSASDWRLPTGNELLSISRITDDDAFANDGGNRFFWSATPVEGYDTKAIVVSTSTGETRPYPKAWGDESVRCVRGTKR